MPLLFVTYKPPFAWGSSAKVAVLPPASVRLLFMCVFILTGEQCVQPGVLSGEGWDPESNHTLEQPLRKFWGSCWQQLKCLPSACHFYSIPRLSTVISNTEEVLCWITSAFTASLRLTHCTVYHLPPEHCYSLTRVSSTLPGPCVNQCRNELAQPRTRLFCNVG